MKLKNLFHIILIIFLTFYGCSQAERKQTSDKGLSLRLSADSTAVELFNIPVHIIEEFRSDSLEASQWKNFFAVYEEPADPEMRDYQAAIDGSYTVTDSLVEFIPTNGFVKGRSYFSRCYTKYILEEPEDIISKRDLSPTDGFLEYKFNIR